MMAMKYASVAKAGASLKMMRHINKSYFLAKMRTTRSLFLASVAFLRESLLKFDLSVKVPLTQGILTSTLFYFSMTSLAYAGLPAGLMIVAYDGVAWHPYIVKTRNGGWVKIDDVRDPAALTWQRQKNVFLIKGNDGGISSYQLETEESARLPFYDESSVTQLRAYRQGVVMVRLMDGRSRDTRILVSENDVGKLNINKSNFSEPHEILRQASAQFHPHIHNDQLYYAHVSCRAECRPLIQEVWSKNLLTGRTQQLTLLNATSYLYSVAADSRYGFLSSNQRGYYHLALLDLLSGEVSWLTGGAVTDSFPSVDPDGDLYFIRRTSAGSRLMKLPAAAKRGGFVSEEILETIELPDAVQKIRYLELNQS